MTSVALIAAALVAVPGTPTSGRLDRVAIVVGNNRGLSDELELRYAETDAEKMAKVLVDLAGFAADDVVLLTGRREHALRSAFDALHHRPRAAGIDARTLLFFYFSGHGDAAHLHMNGTRMPFSTLRDLLGGIDAHVAITVMDSCKSGALTRAKGATLGPAYEIEFLKDPEVEGRIVITSSSEDEISQESDKIEGSFFTHHWVSGLYGAADANADSLVTLEEAYRYAHYRTVEQTIDSSGGVQHPSYNFSLTGQGNVVLANLTRSTARVRLRTSSAPGDYFVLDASRKLILTELAHEPMSTVVLRLPPGDYLIRKREPGRMLTAQVTATNGGIADVADRDMTPTPYAHRSAKSEPAPPAPAHGPTVLLGMRTRLTDTMGPAMRARAGYTLRWPLVFLEPRLAFRLAIPGERDGVAHLEYELGMVVGLHRSFGNLLRLAAGADIGLIVFDSAALGGTPTSSSAAQSITGTLPVGVSTALVGRVEIQVSERIALLLAADTGIVLFQRDSRAARAWVAGLSVGVGYRF